MLKICKFLKLFIVLFSLSSIHPAVASSKTEKSSELGKTAAQNQNKAFYKIETNQFDQKVVDSSPQKLISIKNKKDSAVIKLEVADCAGKIDSLKFEKALYSEETFLNQTDLIDFESDEIQTLSKKLSLETMEPLKAVKTALIFTKSSLQYDRALAVEIGSGSSSGRSASETLREGRGTCSEYANVFIALMRLNNIPCKFISGLYVNEREPSSKTKKSAVPQFMLHAWAEVYIPEMGWIPCDPQAGFFGTTKNHIKLLEGSDFTTCGADFSRIQCRVF